ncbi:hypothetical protein [Chryseobacterium cucumeris]|uniref:hypothetical protein n=1 Tax=Chryseobacterium cucumeris TaxID=1813611 RepID=UPI00192D28A0|nr:hypothetical protein [Chryseobacterium cucumeris]QRA41996.1 hypothetical protein JNG87_15355 [Chryseobacterium cucumeris]
MDKKVADKKVIQLEFDFSHSYSAESIFSANRAVISLNHRYDRIKKHYNKNHKIAQIINIEDSINKIKRERESEIINFIVNNSKSF